MSCRSRLRREDASVFQFAAARLSASRQHARSVTASGSFVDLPGEVQLTWTPSDNPLEVDLDSVPNLAILDAEISSILMS